MASKVINNIENEQLLYNPTGRTHSPKPAILYELLILHFSSLCRPLPACFNPLFGPNFSLSSLTTVNLVTLSILPHTLLDMDQSG